MTRTRYLFSARTKLGALGAAALVLAATACGSTPAPSNPASSTSAQGDADTLTIEAASNLQRCTYASLKLHTRADKSQGQQSIEVHSEAFNGGKVFLTTEHLEHNGQTTALPKGTYEARAYLSGPVGSYTAASRDATGKYAATAAFRVAKEGEKRVPFPYLVEPNIFVDGNAVPNAQVEVTALDEGPDPDEKTVTVSSKAFQTPVQLAFNGKSYMGKATIRSDAAPGRYDLNLVNHFGCGQATAGSVQIAG